MAEAYRPLAVLRRHLVDQAACLRMLAEKRHAPPDSGDRPFCSIAISLCEKTVETRDITERIR
jgi:hypothetical protein